MFDYEVHNSAEIHDSAVIGSGSRIWSRTHIRENVKIGKNVTIGENVYIGPNVSIGSKCKIQNQTQIYDNTIIEDGVFIGPGVIITNDKYPRAINLIEEVRSASEWKCVNSVIGMGASLGAGVICVSPIFVGKWAFAAAGSILVKNVPDFALMSGSPAKQVDWVGRSGIKLKKIDNQYFECQVSGDKYFLENEKELILL